jgi:hypothetical protein
VPDLATSHLGASAEPGAAPPADGGVGCEKGGCYWYVKNEVHETAIGMEYATNVSKPEVSSFAGAHSIDQLAAGAVEEEGTYRYTIETGFDVDPQLFEREQIEKEEKEVAKKEKEDVMPPGRPHLFIFVNPDRYGSESCYIDTVVENKPCEHFIPAAEAKLTPNETLEPSTAKITLGVKYLATCFKGATSGCWWIWAGTQWIGYVPESFWGGSFTHATGENDYGEVFDDESLPTSQMGDGQYGASAGATSMTQIVALLNENGEATTTGYHVEQTNASLYSPGDVNAGKSEWHFGGPGIDPVPIVTTEGSSVNPPSSVEVKGAVDPNNLETHYYFEYGPTTSYGSVTSTEPAGSGVEPVSVKATLTKLKPGTTYHYRLVAYNTDGHGHGADSTFNVPWWFIQATQNPHGSSETDGFRGVSCWSATACDAVGINTNSEDEIAGLVERWNGSSWAVQSTPKSTGATEDNLESIACLSASECEATGYAEVAEGKHATLAERWNGTAWSVQSTPTQGNTSNLVSVSCSWASECVARGVYLSSSGKQSTLVELWNGKEWKILTTATLPKEDERSWFESVSCPSSKHCTAVGVAVTTLNGIVPLAESYNGTTWTVQTTPTPENSLEAQLSGVSCSATSACTSVGEYYSSKEKAYRALVERYNGTSWALQEAASPVGKPAPKESHWALRAVSCPTSGSCVAVGSYAESASGTKLLGEEWNGSRWELARPVERAGVVSDEARGVSCSAALTCTLAGQSLKEHSNTETLAERMWEQ